MEFPKRRVPLANIQANVSPDLADAVRAVCRAHGVTFKAAVEFGLRAFLEQAARTSVLPPTKRRG